MCVLETHEHQALWQNTVKLVCISQHSELLLVKSDPRIVDADCWGQRSVTS